jgi:uncharacterized protein YbaP (TraB family)
MSTLHWIASTSRRVALAAALAWSGAGAWAQGGAAACPPQIQPPTAEQIQAAQRDARDRGALWRITRDGNTSYLYGTLHVGKLEWVMPGPQVRAALGATDTIALEIDPTDPQMLARMNTAGAQGAAAPRLDAELEKRMARRLEAACLPPQVRPAIDAQHPAMRAITLSLLEARWEGLDVGYGQEFALAGFGRAAQRRIVSLESPESQMAALIPKDPAEVDKLIVGTLDQLDKGTARRTVARMAAAWASGDMTELERYERWCECVLDESDRKLMHRLIDERNPVLAEGIEQLHKEGRKVFAAVGALHMVGPMALPVLLKARGFTVERVAFQ